MREIELYLHIPFCIRKCGYCDFLSWSCSRQEQKMYLQALLREIRAVGSLDEYLVSTVFLGGGTPSVLPGEWIGELLDEIRANYRLTPEAEISMEANPGTVTPGQLETCRVAGINRISFGCQSADNRELKTLGRIHTWEEFLESFQMARTAGFANINVDLMSGLPEQTLESWERTLRLTACLEPEHISAYSLIIEEGTPFSGQTLQLPDEDTERQMYQITGELLQEYGYRQYEISNYAKPGFSCRHNIGYWTRKEYLGLGLGASSLERNRRFHNTENMEEYLRFSADPGKLRQDTEILTKKMQMEEFVFLGLRMTEGISRAAFQKEFGGDILEIYGPVIRKYSEMGFLREENGRLRFTSRGISVSNPILAEFLLDDQNDGN